MSNGLNLPGIRNNPATTTKEELAEREQQPTHEDVGKLAERPDAPVKSLETHAPADDQTLRAKLEASLAATGETADDGVVRYSSHPILRYKLGRFRFENGLLELRKAQDIRDFEENLKDLPTSERIRIKKLDISAAEAQVRAVREQNPSASKAIDSSTGDRQPSNQIGRGRLEDSNA